MFSLSCFFLLYVSYSVKGKVNDIVGTQMCSSLTGQHGCLTKGQKSYRTKCQVLLQMCEAMRDGVCFHEPKQNSTKGPDPLQNKHYSAMTGKESEKNTRLMLFFLKVPVAKETLVYDVKSGHVEFSIPIPARLTALVFIKSERKYLASTDSKIVCVGEPCHVSVLRKRMTTKTFAVDEKKFLVFFFSISETKRQSLNRFKILLVRMTTNGNGFHKLLTFYVRLDMASIVVDSANAVLFIGIGDKSVARHDYRGLLLGYLPTESNAMVLSLYNDERGIHLYYTRNKSLFKWSSTNGSEELFSVPATYAVESGGKLFFTVSNHGHVYECKSKLQFRKVKRLSVSSRNIGIIGIP